MAIYNISSKGLLHNSIASNYGVSTLVLVLGIRGRKFEGKILQHCCLNYGRIPCLRVLVEDVLFIAVILNEVKYILTDLYRVGAGRASILHI